MLTPTDWDVFSRASQWHIEGAGVILARVTAVWGSGPNPVGSCMAIRDDGHFMGSVSGGCIEGAVIEEGLALLASGDAAVFDFGINNTQAWDAGLSCGGKISIYIETLSDAKVQCLQHVLKCRSERKPTLLLTDISTGEMSSGDFPKENLPDHLTSDDHGGMTNIVTKALTEDKSHILEIADKTYFLHVFNPPLRIFVIGAVHITQAMASVTSLLNFEVIVIDPRTAFANRERFPTLTLDTRWPDEVLEAVQLDSRSAVVTLAHDAKLDDAALSVALKSPAFYIGSLGSKKTHAARLKRLEKSGFQENDLNRIHGPVGINIGSQGPSEIAISIVAEIIKVIRQPNDDT